MFLCSEGALARDRVAAVEVRDLLLDLAGVTEGARAGAYGMRRAPAAARDPASAARGALQC